MVEAPVPAPEGVLSRRALIGKTVGKVLIATGVAAFSDRLVSPQTVDARAAELNLPAMNSENELFSRLIPQVEIEPADESLATREFVKVDNLYFNIDEVPDAPQRVTSAIARTLNTMYRNRGKYEPDKRGDLEASLAGGEIPDDSLSKKFVETIEAGKAPTIGINAFDMDAMDPSQKKYIKIKPTEGVGLKAVDGVGYFNLGLISFTPRVDENGMLHIELAVADNPDLVVNPKIVQVVYTTALEQALEFMAITGGDQELWDTYVQRQTGETTPFMEQRAKNAGSIFKNTGVLLRGPLSENGSGYAGPRSIKVATP